MEITWEKLMATGVAACFFVVCCIDLAIQGQLRAFFVPLFAVLMPLAIIWCDEILGGLTGFVRGSYMSESPAVAVRFCGWLLLLGIIGIAIYARFKGQG